MGATMDKLVYMYVIERKEKKKKRKPEIIYSLNVPTLEEDSLKEVLQKCQYGREIGS